MLTDERSFRIDRHRALVPGFSVIVRAVQFDAEVSVIETGEQRFLTWIMQADRRRGAEEIDLVDLPPRCARDSENKPFRVPTCK